MRFLADFEDIILFYDFYSATSLFNIWTKYAPRLPADYYNEKLLKVGDSLCEMKVSASGKGLNETWLIIIIWFDTILILHDLIFFLRKI